MTIQRWRPEVEALEDRMLLHAGHGLAAFRVHAVTQHGHHRRHHHPLPPGGAGDPGQAVQSGAGDPEQAAQAATLTGTVTGSWQGEFTIPDTGRDQVLQGSGTVAPLGVVLMSGELHTPGFIVQGRAGGTVTLTSGGGSVTLQLVGPLQPGFSPPPPTFEYTVTGATGQFADLAGRGGIITFQEQVLPTGSGTFAMTFGSATS